MENTERMLESQFTAEEKDMLSYLSSIASTCDNNTVEFSASDFFKFCGRNPAGERTLIEEIKDTFSKLQSRVFWVDITNSKGNPAEKAIHLFNLVYINKDTGKVTVCYNE